MFRTYLFILSKDSYDDVQCQCYWRDACQVDKAFGDLFVLDGWECVVWYFESEGILW